MSLPDQTPTTPGIRALRCVKPVPFQGRTAPCSRCEPCRRLRAFFTISRLLVEGLAHEAIALVTLTYARKNLPPGGTLVPGHVREWARRLRRRFDHHSGKVLRFFIVGEYGGKFGRPHYHVIVFGADLSTTVNGEKFLSVVRDCWGLGMVHIGDDWSDQAAGYVSGYVVKGHNVRGLDLLRGRHPEFSRWPQRPGLGVPGLAKLPLILNDGDVVPQFTHAGRSRPLGAFLLDKARLAAGLSPADIRALKDRAREAGRVEARSLYPDRLADLTGGDVASIDAALSLLPYEVA